MISKERKAKFYTLVYKPSYSYNLKSGEGYPKFPQSKIETFDDLIILGLMKGTHRTYKEQGRSTEISIQDYQVDEKHITLLIRVVSNRYSDPAYIHKSTKKRSKVERDELQEMEFNSHVMIGRKVTNGESLMLVEQVAGFSKSRLRSIVNAIFSHAKNTHKDKFQHPHKDNSVDADGKQRMAKFRVVCDIEGVASDTLKRDIENGEITAVEIVSRDTSSKWDDHGHVTESARKVALKLTAPVGSRMLALQDIASKAKTKLVNAERINLRFKDILSNSSESVSFDLGESDPFDCEYFNKTLELGYSAEYTSHDGFVDDIIRKMKPHFR